VIGCLERFPGATVAKIAQEAEDRLAREPQARLPVPPQKPDEVPGSCIRQVSRILKFSILWLLCCSRSAGGRLFECNEKFTTLRGAEESLRKADQSEVPEVADDLAE
jgi:hypothetical protein